MTTYRTKDHQEFERYEKFTIKSIATLTWIPLLIGENRVRYFESSQLTEVVDPRLTGMVYGCAIPQNFDSGLDYCYPMPAPKPLIIALPADMIGQTPIPKGKNKRPTIPGVILDGCAHVLVIEPPTLWHEALKPAA